MYSYIKGQVIQNNDTSVVIEANGVGYEILASFDCRYNVNVGSMSVVHTYLHVKEDSHTLFGFATAQEKALFVKLLTVSGVGPKSALNLLSIGHDALCSSIANGNINIKGVSKKSADKIILELGGKIDVGQAGSELDDAIAGLVSLGMQRAVALDKIKKIDISNMNAEDIIRAVFSK